MFFSSILFASIFLAQGSRDITPPIDYSLVPPWVIFAAAFAGLTLLGVLGWLILRRRPASQPPQLPRERALEALEHMEIEIETDSAFGFRTFFAVTLQSNSPCR
jgi:hypothetical protein